MVDKGDGIRISGKHGKRFLELYPSPADHLAMVGTLSLRERRYSGVLLILFACILWVEVPMAEAQVQKCFVLCAPTVKIEPTFTWENLFKAPQISETDDQGQATIRKTSSENVFETVLAVDVPSTIPRTSFVFEFSFKPFAKGSSPELETEVNFHWLRSENTKGWVSSHFDLVDKYSPGGRPDNADTYTHKFNLELDTAVPILKWTRKPWLEDIELEGSIDYVASGLPRAGDTFGNLTYLDNASRWSFSLVFVLPLAPLK